MEVEACVLTSERQIQSERSCPRAIPHLTPSQTIRRLSQDLLKKKTPLHLTARGNKYSTDKEPLSPTCIRAQPSYVIAGLGGCGLLLVASKRVKGGLGWRTDGRECCCSGCRALIRLTNGLKAASYSLEDAFT